MNKVKGYRNMIGYTQKQMAEALDMPLRSYMDKENGITDFSIEKYKAIRDLFNAKGLKLKIDDLI